MSPTKKPPSKSHSKPQITLRTATLAMLYVRPLWKHKEDLKDPKRWIGAGKKKRLGFKLFRLTAFSGLHHHYIIFFTRHLSIHGFSNPYIVKVAIIFVLCVQQLKATEQNAKTLCMQVSADWDFTERGVSAKMTASVIRCNQITSLSTHTFTTCVRDSWI